MAFNVAVMIWLGCNYPQAPFILPTPSDAIDRLGRYTHRHVAQCRMYSRGLKLRKNGENEVGVERSWQLRDLECSSVEAPGSAPAQVDPSRPTDKKALLHLSVCACHKPV